MEANKFEFLEKFVDDEFDFNFSDMDVDSFLDREEYSDDICGDVNCDLFKAYLKEIGKYSLLTKEEEIKYGKDLLFKNNISILADKKIDGNIYSVMDLEKIFVSIDNVDTFKCVFELLNDYCFNSYKMNSIDNSVLNYYLSSYFELVSKEGIPSIDLLNKFFSNDNKYNIFSNFDVSKKIDSQELIKQVSMCVKYLRAKEVMINHNLRLVVSIAKRYARYMDIMDLIISGNIGLIRAVDRFDISMENKFSTYAEWLIKKEIFTELNNNSSNIRIPINRKNKIFAFWRNVWRLNYKYGRKLTIYEIALELKMTVKEVEKYILYSKNTTSLDVVIDSDEDETLMDIVAISDFNVEDIILNMDLKERINDILSNFDDREIQIIKGRYRLNSCVPKTLVELAREFDVSFQYINQIESKTLKKMKKLALKCNLDDYL